MDSFDKRIYDDFYVAYFDMSGRIIYPSDEDEVKLVKKMLKDIDSNHIVYLNDRGLYYKVRFKRKIYDDSKIQVVELSNITEYVNQISKASVDEITHLNTRKIARDLFKQYIEKAYKNHESFSIILADLDGFKEVNDTYGHVNGDVVLSEISRMIYCATRQESYREQDIVARLGGDEFVIVLKNIPEALSIKRAEQIRTDVEQHKIVLFSEDKEKTYIKAGTMSMGLYHITYNDLENFYNKGYTTDEIRTTVVDRCDSALYFSKNNGKNRVTTYTENRPLILERTPTRR